MAVHESCDKPRRRLGRLGAGTVAWLVALSGMAGALPAHEDVDTEIRFAEGLRKFGYFDLAIDQFRELNWRKQEKPSVRLRIVTGLIDTSLEASRHCALPREALRHTSFAAEELKQFLSKARLNELEQCRMAMKEGELMLDRGLLARKVCARRSQSVDIEQTAAEGMGALDKSVAAFEKAIEGYDRIVRRVEDKDDIGDRDRLLRREGVTQKLSAQTSIGWAHFRRALLMQCLDKNEEAQPEFERAASVFQDLAGEHEGLAAGLSATLGWALCLQELGRHEEAVDGFEKVLETRPSRHIAMILYQAGYGLSWSLAALHRHQEAIDNLDLTRRQWDPLPEDLLRAWRLRYARILGQAAEALRAGKPTDFNTQGVRTEEDDVADDSRSKPPKTSRPRPKESARLYRGAMSVARKLIDGDDAYAREARLLLGKWAEESTRRQTRKTATQFFAEGERLFEGGRPGEAVKVYREAIRLSRGSGLGRKRRADAWIQMGKAYAKAGRNYEAGLVLGYVADMFTKNRFAEKAAVYSAMLLGAEYQKGGTFLEARSYLEAQERLVEHFNGTPEAQRAALRLADLRRSEGRLEEAARFYKKVNRASPYFERAGYLAGRCLWQEAVGQGEGERAETLLDRAEAHLKPFVKWSEEQPQDTSPDGRARRMWTGRARLLLGEVLLLKKRYPAVLDLAAEERIARLRDLRTEKEDIYAGARLLRLRAYCAPGTLEGVRRAATEMDALVENRNIAAATRSMAARLVGMVFLDLANKSKGDADAGKALLADARKYLVLSVELHPEQTIEQYTEVAAPLYQSGAYREAARIFERLVSRLGDSPEGKDKVQDARRWVGMCYLQAGEHRKAAATFEKLVEEYPSWLEIRRELAGCLESDALKRYADAARQWQRIESASPAGGSAWLDARFHRIRALIRAGKGKAAFSILAATVLADPRLGGGDIEKRFLTLVEEELDEEQKATFRKLRKEGLEASP